MYSSVIVWSGGVSPLKQRDIRLLDFVVNRLFSREIISNM